MAEKMLTNWFAFLLHKFLKVRMVVGRGLEVRVGWGSCPSEPGLQGCMDVPPASPFGAGTYLARCPQTTRA